MKKIIICLVVLVFLCGCSDTNDSNDNSLIKDVYRGSLLEVGVVGSKSLPNVENIQYKYVELSEVSGKKGEFDVLIITPEAFTEADKNKYITLYENIEYPVFFFGMKDFKMFAFTNESMTIEDSKDDNVAYVEGFKNIDGKKEGIKFYKSEEEDESDTDMLIKVFNSL